MCWSNLGGGEEWKNKLIGRLKELKELKGELIEVLKYLV